MVKRRRRQLTAKELESVTSKRPVVHKVCRASEGNLLLAMGTQAEEREGLMSEAAQLYRARCITGAQYSRIPKNASELFKDYGISKLGRYILPGMRAKQLSSLTDVDPFVS